MIKIKLFHMYFEHKLCPNKMEEEAVVFLFAMLSQYNYQQGCFKTALKSQLVSIRPIHWISFQSSSSAWLILEFTLL